MKEPPKKWQKTDKSSKADAKEKQSKSKPKKKETEEEAVVEND